MSSLQVQAVRRFSKAAVLAAAVAVMLLTPGPSMAEPIVIYQESFSGTTGADLNGTAADVALGQYGGTANANWTASAWWDFTADGKVAPGSSTPVRNAFLPFTPESGNLYTLTADLNNMGGSNWFALGFTSSANTGGPSTGGFNTPGMGAYGWVLLRGVNDTTNSSVFYGGASTSNAQNFSVSADHRGDQQIEITLDTRGTNWTTTATFLSDNESKTYTYTTNPSTIAYVGFSAFTSATGTVDNFKLTVVPEPGTLVLLGAGLLGLLAYAWRRRK